MYFFQRRIRLSRFYYIYFPKECRIIKAILYLPPQRVSVYQSSNIRTCIPKECQIIKVLTYLHPQRVSDYQSSTILLHPQRASDYQSSTILLHPQGVSDYQGSTVSSVTHPVVEIATDNKKNTESLYSHVTSNTSQKTVVWALPPASRTHVKPYTGLGN